MAHSLSAKKRVRQNETRRIINRGRKSQVKSLIKRFEDAIGQGDVQLATSELYAVCKKLDKTAATSTLHKNTAARKKSRLTRRLNALKAKTA